jgi:isocitrate dehydrogenase (NAD+)
LAYSVTLIPGDGIGPEVSDAARRCLEATGIGIDWDVHEAGAQAWEREGDPLPEHVVESIRVTGVALKGPISTPTGSGYRSANIALRDRLDLYAGIRPCRALDGVRTPFPHTDIAVVRMTGEDLYAGIEYERGMPATERLRALIAETDGRRLPADTGISIKPLSVSNAKRVITRAFEYARGEGRSKVTAVHKASVMRYTDGLFLAVAREVARDYPDLEFGERLVDSVCHDLVARPGASDVLVLPVMYGDIISDIGAGLIGGLGMVPGANVGDDCAVFEAAHGSAPRHAGRGTANPIGLILSGVMLLRHLGEATAAERLTAAVEMVVREGRSVTPDLKPRRDDPTAVRTSEVADAVIDTLQRERTLVTPDERGSEVP